MKNQHKQIILPRKTTEAEERGGGTEMCPNPKDSGILKERSYKEIKIK